MSTLQSGRGETVSSVQIKWIHVGMRELPRQIPKTFSILISPKVFLYCQIVLYTLKSTCHPEAIRMPKKPLKNPRVVKDRYGNRVGFEGEDEEGVTQYRTL